MPINPATDRNVVSIDAIRQRQLPLVRNRNKIAKNISDIKNSIDAINKRTVAGNNLCNEYRLLLKNLVKVTCKHGDNATVRLKNNCLKPAEARNFFKKIFHGNRYQTEREAAAKLIQAAGDKVSAGEARATLQARLDATISKLDEIKAEASRHNIKLNDLKAQKDAIQKDIDELTETGKAAKEAEDTKNKARQNFSMIYQSNAGCRMLNAEARHQFGNALSRGNLKGSEVIAEYCSAHGYEIFSSGNKQLKFTIKSNCDDLQGLVKMGAEVLYTRAGKNITTYRGQGMTPNGIAKLIKQFNADKQNNTKTVYQPAQFFSTSLKMDVANDFAKRSQDSVKVIYKVTGNSSNGLSIPGGLPFNNDESERLYSPLANFTVTNIVKTRQGNYLVNLEEVNKVNNAQILPY